MSDFSGFASKAPRRRSRFGLTLALGLAALTLTVTTTKSFAQNAPTAAGFWQSSDDDGKPTGWFYFVDKGGVFEGRLVKMFKVPGQPLLETCGKCPGAQKDAPMLGLTIVKGMKRNGAEYHDGSILDPRDGSVYHAQMEVSPDGQSLYVRGYLGIPALGQTKTWTRLPNDAMAAAEIPPDSVAGKVAPKPKPVLAHKPAAPAPAPAQQ